jgi:aspartate dehydrogenase
MKLGLVGFGAIATLALDALVETLAAPLETLILFSRPSTLEDAQTWVAGYAGRLAREVTVVTDPTVLVEMKPDVVGEAAGHAALANVGERILAAGIDLIVSSVGALSDDALKRRLDQAAERAGARLLLSPGAIGGLDILAAARLSGLASVTYTSRKPPLAWAGTAAEDVIDLAGIAAETVFFEGAAREAARDFPQNANVAATIALAGLGFDATRVRLVADPAVTRNVHEISFVSGCADVTMRIEGRPSDRNPKTSATAGYALAQMVLAHIGPAC